MYRQQGDTSLVIDVLYGSSIDQVGTYTLTIPISDYKFLAFETGIHTIAGNTWITYYKTLFYPIVSSQPNQYSLNTFSLTDTNGVFHEYGVNLNFPNANSISINTVSKGDASSSGQPADNTRISRIYGIK